MLASKGANHNFSLLRLIGRDLAAQIPPVVPRWELLNDDNLEGRMRPVSLALNEKGQIALAFNQPKVKPAFPKPLR